MVSGADSLETETAMYGGSRGADSSSEDMEEPLDNDHSVNGNTSRNGNVEESNSTPEGENASESMDVEPAQRGTSILSNPARFEALIRSLFAPHHSFKSYFKFAILIIFKICTS